MRIIWAHHPITAADVIARLTQVDATWHPKTVRTLLARLVAKKALDYQEHGRVFVYEPRVTENECVAAVSGSFVDRVFGGSLKPMLAHFIEQKQLTRAELDELRALLDEHSSIARGAKKKGEKR